jgi:futalosine hydrolase
VSDARVEAMEGFGVLRACALAGVPAIEVRAVSNELAEGDRARWRIGRAIEALADALPRMLEAAAQ